MSWRPIETAPKDGTPILVSCKNRATYAVWWGITDQFSVPTPMGWMLVGGGNLERKTSDSRVALYWQPLPEPPEETGK